MTTYDYVGYGATPGDIARMIIYDNGTLSCVDHKLITSEVLSSAAMAGKSVERNCDGTYRIYNKNSSEFNLGSLVLGIAIGLIISFLLTLYKRR